MHPFDDWLAQVYPPPQPAGTRETALIARNAAIHAACEALSLSKGQFVMDRRYEQAAVTRDLVERK
jgi:hypothetical protein